MKKTIFNILTAFCLLSGTLAFAQDYNGTPVTISTEKVRMDGSLYYSHLVLEKQTLFSISKAYGVSLEDIYKANPALNLEAEGLKDRQIILIPVKSNPKLETVTEPVRSSSKDDEDYIEHITKWYETLGTLSFKYSIDVEILMKYNNLSSQNLTSRQIVRIPQGKTLEKLLSEAGKETATVVAEAETAPEIKQEQTPEAETETVPEAKPEDKKDEVQNLKEKLASIFTSKAKSEPVQEPEEDTIPEPEQQPVSGVVTDDVEITESTDSTGFDIYEIQSTDYVTTSIILPLGANGNVNNSNFDFYCGALLAVKDLQAEGIHSNLKVFDLSAGMPLEGDLDGSNLILGPVNSQDIESVKAIAPAGTAVISPLDPKGISVAKNLIGVIQAPSSIEIQCRDLIEWIREDMENDDKIILVTEKGSTPAVIAEYLAQSGMEYDILSYGILEGRDITGSLASLMTQSGKNRFLIASDKEAFANDVIRNINLMIFNKYEAILYAPSKMRNFETIEVENFHTAGMHLSNSYYVDYNDSKVKSFLYAYRALCGAEPTPFAYQGYDTAYYFIKQYAQFGPAWIHNMETAKGLQSNFNFVQEENAGYYNVGVRRVVFGPDYSTEIIDRF